jgi:hypothetical protein
MAKRAERLLALPRPRVVNDVVLAAYIGKSVSWLAEHRLKLEAQGFPKRLAVVGGNDLEAVDQWLDRLHTQVGANGGSAVNVDDLWRKATGNVGHTRS